MLLIKLTPVIPLLLQITCNKQLHWSACGNWYTGCTLVIWNFFQYNCIVLKIFVIFIINENIVFGHTTDFVLYMCVLALSLWQRTVVDLSLRFIFSRNNCWKYTIWAFLQKLTHICALLNTLSCLFDSYPVYTVFNSNFVTFKLVILKSWNLCIYFVL